MVSEDLICCVRKHVVRLNDDDDDDNDDDHNNNNNNNQISIAPNGRNIFFSSSVLLVSFPE